MSPPRALPEGCSHRRALRHVDRVGVDVGRRHSRGWPRRRRPGAAAAGPAAAATQSFGSCESGSFRACSARLTLSTPVARARGWAPACRAGWRCASAHSRPRPPSSRGAWPRPSQRPPVTSGAANDVPSGVLRRLGGLRDALGARGDDPDPVHRRHEIDLRSPRRALPDLRRGARLQPAHAEHARLRGGEVVFAREPRRCRPRRPPARPSSCSARRDSMSARDGRAVAETFTTCAPCCRSQPNAATRPCSSTVCVAGGRSDDARRQQRRVGRQPHDARRPGRFATSMLATAVPCPIGS